MYNGVSAMGVDLSGKTRDEARRALLGHAANYVASPLTLKQGEQTFTVTPQQLGLGLEVDPVIQQAYQFGRAGSLSEQYRQRIPMLSPNRQIEAKYALDRGMIEKYLAGVAPQVARDPVDSVLSLQADGKLVASQEVAGQKLDIGKATDALYSQMAALGKGEVALPVLPVEPAVHRDDWRSRARLREQVTREGVTLSFGERQWKLTPAQLGSAIVVHKADGKVVGSFSPARVARLLAPVAANVARMPVAATLKIEGTQAVLTEEVLGEKLDTQATAQSVIASLPGARQAEITTLPVPAPLTASDLAPGKERLDALLSGPVTLVHGEKKWTIPVSKLAGDWTTLAVNPQSRAVSVGVRGREIEKWVASLAPAVYRAPVNATLEIKDATPVLTPEVTGEQLDTKATTEAFLAALWGKHSAGRTGGVAAAARSAERQVSVVTTPLHATLTAADLTPSKARLDTLLGSPFTLTFGTKKWSVSSAQLAEWTTLTVDSKRRDAAITFDEAAARRWLRTLKEGVYKEPKSGRLTWIEPDESEGDEEEQEEEKPAKPAKPVAPLTWQQKLKVTEPSADGHELDEDKAVATFVATVFTNTRTMAVPVKVVKPRVPTEDLAALGIREVIGEGSSMYGGSKWERIVNIQVASKYLDNTVVAPGDSFDFLDSIGWISEENGYELSKIIDVTNDVTRLGVGGGVCQVSTTMFRAAFWSGLPITERYPHLFTIDTYTADAPLGFDAAIGQPWASFKFKNTTNGWLLIRAKATDSDLKITIYGTDPGYDVKRFSWKGNYVSPPPPKYIIDRSLPPGFKKQTESGRAGETAVITRKVYKNGKLVKYKEDDGVYESYYEPWRDVYRIGPPKGFKIPQPDEDSEDGDSTQPKLSLPGVPANAEIVIAGQDGVE